MCSASYARVDFPIEGRPDSVVPGLPEETVCFADEDLTS
jgi:hypothetical protein